MRRKIYYTFLITIFCKIDFMSVRPKVNYVQNVHNKSESQLQRPKWISAKYCDIMWALLLLEIKINFIFCDSRNVTTMAMPLHITA